MLSSSVEGSQVVTVTTTRRSHIDPKDLPDVQRATLRRIFTYLRPYRTQSVLVLLAIVLAAGLGLAPALCIQRIVDDAIPRRDRLELVALAGAMSPGRCSPGCSASCSATSRRTSPSTSCTTCATRCSGTCTGSR